jgi:hypothetical protein
MKDAVGWYVNIMAIHHMTGTWLKYVMHDNTLFEFPEISTYIKYKSI